GKVKQGCRNKRVLQIHARTEGRDGFAGNVGFSWACVSAYDTKVPTFSLVDSAVSSGPQVPILSLVGMCLAYPYRVPRAPLNFFAARESQSPGSIRRKNFLLRAAIQHGIRYQPQETSWHRTSPGPITEPLDSSRNLLGS